MTDEKWTRDQKINAVAASVGVITLILNQIDPITHLIGPFYPIVQPIAFLAIGSFIGYAFTRSADNKVIESKNAEISRLKESHEKEIERLIPDDAVRSTLEHYRYLLKSGKSPRLVVQTHETIMMDGGRDSAEVARLSAKVEKLEKELDSARLEITEERDRPRKAIERGKYAKPSEEMLSTIPADLAGAAYKAFNAGGVVKFSTHDRPAQDTMLRSIRERNGVFDIYFTINPFGSANPAEGFRLEQPWMAWLQDPIHLEQLKAASGTWWVGHV